MANAWLEFVKSEWAKAKGKGKSYAQVLKECAPKYKAMKGKKRKGDAAPPKKSKKQKKSRIQN